MPLLFLSPSVSARVPIRAALLWTPSALIAGLGFTARTRRKVRFHRLSSPGRRGSWRRCLGQLCPKTASSVPKRAGLSRNSRPNMRLPATGGLDDATVAALQAVGGRPGARHADPMAPRAGHAARTARGDRSRPRTQGGGSPTPTPDAPAASRGAAIVYRQAAPTGTGAPNAAARPLGAPGPSGGAAIAKRSPNASSPCPSTWASRVGRKKPNWRLAPRTASRADGGCAAARGSS